MSMPNTFQFFNRKIYIISYVSMYKGYIMEKTTILLDKKIIEGDEIRYSDLKSINKFIVDYPKDTGHITIFRFLDKWIFIFYASYNQAKIKDFNIASKEFYESAKDDLDKGRLRPLFENCWASAELSSACHSLSLGGEYEKHDDNIEKFKNWSELGNVDKKHSDILIRLQDTSVTHFIRLSGALTVGIENKLAVTFGPDGMKACLAGMVENWPGEFPRAPGNL